MKLRRLLIIPGTALLALVATALVSDGGEWPTAQIEPAAPRTLVATAIGNGQLRPTQRVEVESEVGGRVTAVLVREGSVVRAGDVLVQVERRRAQVAVTRAVASLTQARAVAAQVQGTLTQSRSGLHRAESIAASSGLLATVELEQARTQARSHEASHASALSGVDAAEAALADARDGLSKTTIVAPIGGTVTRLQVRVGEMLGGGASPNAAVATIADLSAIEAVIRVSENDLPRIHLGDSATVKVEAFSRERLPGRVTHIGPASMASGQGRQSAFFEVIITLAPTTRPLYPDLTVTAEIIAERRIGVLGVPLLAVMMRTVDGHRHGAAAEGKPKKARSVTVEGVFVLQDGVSRFKPVRTGIVGDQYVEILRGLTRGESVIVGPYSLLRDLETGMELDTDTTATPDLAAARGAR